MCFEVFADPGGRSEVRGVTAVEAVRKCPSQTMFVVLASKYVCVDLINADVEKVVMSSS